MADFTGSTADGHISGVNAAWATARATATAHSVTGADFSLGWYYAGSGSYYYYRGFLVFDTSDIGADATITQANLSMVCVANAAITKFDIQIVKYNWSEWEAAQSNTTYRETAYDGCLSADADNSIWRNTTGLPANTQYTSGNLSTDWINKTGKTYYGLRSSLDLDGTEPTGNAYIKLASQTHGTEGYRPVLTVLYSAGASGNPHYYYAQL